MVRGGRRAKGAAVALATASVWAGGAAAPADAQILGPLLDGLGGGAQPQQPAPPAAPPVPAPGAPGTPQEPLLGVPAITELVQGRAEVTLDPAFWTQIVRNAIVDHTVVLPVPVDVVKPEQALPTAPVATGPKPSPLPRRTVELDDVSYQWQGRAKTVRQYVASTETDIAAFVHRGRIVDDLYANGWDAETRHQPWSVTKSFVSALVGIAVEQRRVRSIEDPIERYVPDLRGTAWQGTTIRNLLEMESGVHWDEGTPVLPQNTQIQQWVQHALDLYTNGAAGQTRNEFLAALPRVAPQGTKFAYNSGNTQVLAWMLEKVYGKPFNRVISEQLWAPAGMAGDARVMTDRTGDAIASQGLYSRVFDLARFGELFRNGGRTPAGRQVVPERWVRASTTMSKVSAGTYAFQWWAGGLPRSFEAVGFQGQRITVAPERCLTGVRLSHTLGGDLRPTDGDPADPASYGFEIVDGGAEWNAVVRAVTKRLGGC